MSDEESGEDCQGWWGAKDEDVAHEVVELVERLANDQQWRRTMWRIRMGAYRGYRVPYLGPHAYRCQAKDADLADEKGYQILKSVVDSAKAKIASKQRPKAVFLSKGGDYSQRIRAKKLSRYCEAWLHQKHGPWNNAWELGEQAFKDSAMQEAGVIKVIADPESQRIIYERCFSYEFCADERDAWRGEPQVLTHSYPIDRAELMGRYPNCKDYPNREEAIESATNHISGLEHDYDPTVRSDSDIVQVYEAWRLPINAKTPGRHTVAVNCGDGDGCLLDEEWEHDRFPIAKILWEPDEFGMWGTPLVDQGIEPQSDANKLYKAVAGNVQLNGHSYILVDRGSNPKGHDQNDEGQVIEYDGTAPQLVQPRAFQAEVQSLADSKRSLVFELTGISETASQGRKEAGVDSGVALRTLNDMGSERFLPKARAYEWLFVQLAELTVMVTDDMQDNGVDLSVALPGFDGLDEIKWQDVRMNRANIACQPASSFPDTLAGRMQSLQEMASNGFISPEAFKRLSMQSNVDLEALTRQEQAQERWIERLIAEAQEADDSVAQISEPADPIMNLALAISQMAEAYKEMGASRAPEANRRLIRNWIVEADQLMNGKQAAPTATDTGMGGDTMGAGMADPLAKGAAPPGFSGVPGGGQAPPMPGGPALPPMPPAE